MAKPIHYAIARLGLDAQDRREMLRVARRLENLPLLTAAAQEGTIGWCPLRVVTRQATPENEADWLEKARTCSMRRLERLPRQQAEEDATRSAEWVDLRMMLPAEVVAIFQRVIRQLSHEERRLINPAEALEVFCADKLAGSGPEALEEARLEAGRDVAVAEETPWEGWPPCPGQDGLHLSPQLGPSGKNPATRSHSSR